MKNLLTGDFIIQYTRVRLTTLCFIERTVIDWYGFDYADNVIKIIS